MKKLFQERKVSRIFYALGFDLIRGYKFEKIADIVKLIFNGLADMCDLMEKFSNVEKKELVFITIPEVNKFLKILSRNMIVYLFL